MATLPSVIQASAAAAQDILGIEPKLHIGAGSVIASGSILTVDVPPRGLIKARAGSVVRPLPGNGQPPTSSETASG